MASFAEKSRRRLCAFLFEREAVMSERPFGILLDKGMWTQNQGGLRMKLSIRIISNDQGGFTAVCPTLPGCMSRGRTRQDAREKLDEAIRGYFAAVNNFVPEHLPPEIIEVA